MGWVILAMLKFSNIVLEILLDGLVDLDIEEFKQFIASQEAKDLLIKNTDELIKRGGFGSPTFFYKEKMFFGNDRLHLLEEVISKNLI